MDAYGWPEGERNGKYGLSQSDFYQLQAYGLSYLEGVGDVVLIYPRTDAFADPLHVFDFPKTSGMRLWVLPFCLKERCLRLPSYTHLRSVFPDGCDDANQDQDFNMTSV
ncbi:5-methylcytosine restriction system specificity protein McrC [Aquabacterium sp.]|uniref:5-methylcytosine restriction system specificity protein McrC n=1 Tax=Aquabacterium sp. TaxID=1872578 RepID=UPI003BB131BB